MGIYFVCFVFALNGLRRWSTRTSTVLIDELDACGFERTADGKVVCRCH